MNARARPEALIAEVLGNLALLLNRLERFQERSSSGHVQGWRPSSGTGESGSAPQEPLDALADSGDDLVSVKARRRKRPTIRPLTHDPVRSSPT